MTILPKLHAIYSAAGLHPLTGHSTYHMFDWMDAPFTRFFNNGGLAGEGGGIVGCAGLSLFEIMFMEHLRDYLQPKNILVIGNAHGWSTIAASLTWPDAKIVAIDPDDVGIELTNKLAEANGLKITGVVEYSPGGVAPSCEAHLDGPPEFVLIDAIHTNEAIVTDFRAASAVAAPDCAYLFHDVVNWRMMDGLKVCQAESGLDGRVLTRTPSGMAMLFKDPSPEFLSYVDCFSDNSDLLKAYRDLIRRQFSKQPVEDVFSETVRKL